MTLKEPGINVSNKFQILFEESESSPQSPLVKTGDIVAPSNYVKTNYNLKTKVNYKQNAKIKKIFKNVSLF